MLRDRCWRGDEQFLTGPSGPGRPVPAELVFDRVDEGLPRGFDDVVGHADGTPGLVAVTRGDQDARLRGRALRLVEDADLVVQKLHGLEVRIELFERLAERVVERVHRTV